MRALSGKERALIAASLAAGLAYPAFRDTLPFAGGVALKGAGVGLLAAAALVAGSRLPALFLAFGALGDVLLELAFLAGVGAFACGHAVAILFYRRNRRPTRGPGDFVLPGLLLAFGAVAPFLILRDPGEAATFLIYSLLISAMAASAWRSRFPRALTGLGAILFVASDALIAVRLAERGFDGINLAIWLLYYLGQLLIFAGIRTGRK